MNKTIENLTPRQWALYRLLQSDTNRWFTQREICDAVEGYNYVENPKATNDHCSPIGADKRAINENPRVDQIIVMKDYKFKIATLEEYKEERRSHINRLLAQKRQIEAMDAKFERDGQGKLFNSVFNELKENDKHFYETFGIRNHEDEEEKVPVSVMADFKNKIVYLIHAKRITVTFNAQANMNVARCIMRGGRFVTIPNVEEEIMTLDRFEESVRKGYWSNFKKEEIK